MERKKIGKIKLGIIIFSTVFLLFSSSALAQSQSQASGPEIAIKIVGDIGYDANKKEISIPVSLSNNTDKFFDNLYYGIEIYQGDKLRETGDLFGDLKYSGGGIFPMPDAYKSLSPKETTSFNVNYKHDSGIKSGNYFIKIILTKKDGMAYSMNYSSSPVEIKASDDSLGFFSCYFKAGDKTTLPSIGDPIKSDVSPQVILNLNENKDAIAKIKQGTYFVSSKIYDKQITGKLISTIEKQKANVVEGGKTVIFGQGEEKINLGPVVIANLQSGMDSGTYRVETTLLDAGGKEISIPCYTRWVVAGPSGRINKILTQKSGYQKGESYDLRVELVGPPDESNSKGMLNVILYDVKNQKIDEIVKDNLTLGSDPLTVTFSDKVFNKKTDIKRIELKLFGENNKELDSQTFSYKEVSKTASVKKISGFTFLAIMFTVIFVLAIIILLLKKWNGNVSVFLIILLILTSTAFGLANNTLAADQTPSPCCYPHSLTAWYSQIETTSCSGSSATYTVSVSATAGNCINGITGGVWLNATGAASAAYGLDDKGHVTAGTWGPFAITGYGTSIDFSSNYKVGDVNLDAKIVPCLYNGCNMYACWYYPTWDADAMIFPGCTQTESDSRSVTCCSPANGVCSNPPIHYNCSAGVLGSTAEYATNWQWGCNGTCGGTNVSCTEMKPPAACGGANGNSYCDVASVNAAGLCSAGTASAVSGTGPWTWTCTGSNTVSCGANRSVVNGACGSAKGTPACSAPSANLCASGTASAVSGTGPWTWSCAGLCGGTTDNSCVAPKDSAYDGACGTATSNPSCQPPSSNLCNVGSASNVTVNGTKWNWTCSGYCGGNTKTCFSDKNCQTNWKEVIP